MLYQGISAPCTIRKTPTTDTEWSLCSPRATVYRCRHWKRHHTRVFSGQTDAPSSAVGCCSVSRHEGQYLCNDATGKMLRGDLWLSEAKVPAVFGEVFEKTFTPSLITRSFRKCGIYPFDSVVPKEMMMDTPKKKQYRKLTEVPWEHCKHQSTGNCGDGITLWTELLKHEW